MSNNLAGLNTNLALLLRDTTYKTWTTGEIDSILTWAVAQLYPRIVYPLLAQSYTQTLTKGTYFYALNPAIVVLSRVDYVDPSGFEAGSLGDVWEVDGSLEDGTAKLHISPLIADAGGTLRYVGYGRYDTGTNLIPDRLVPLVMAMGRVEAFNRIVGDRQRYKQWASASPTQNSTVNELLTLLNVAERERDREWAMNRTWRKPVPGRVG